MNLFVFTGRLRAGKDWLAEKLGCRILSVAEPMYEAADHFLGTRNKDLPHVRKFLQMIGQWGRGENLPDEANLPKQSEVLDGFKNGDFLSSEFKDVNWEGFGKAKDFWNKIVISRAQLILKKDSNIRIAVVNARFPDELDTFAQAGFQHFHVKCSNETRIKRIGSKYDPKMEEDATETFAKELDLNNNIFAVWAENSTPPIGAMQSLDFINLVELQRTNPTMCEIKIPETNKQASIKPYIL